jgi:hypothetical protein
MASQSPANVPGSLIVTVTNGMPAPDPAPITSTGTVQFNNNDSKNYLIELWDHGNASHAAVCIYLPANGSVTFMADPSDPNAKCHYNLLTTSGQPTDPTGGGGHTIIIGSGGL